MLLEIFLYSSNLSIVFLNYFFLCLVTSEIVFLIQKTHKTKKQMFPKDFFVIFVENESILG